MAVPKKRTSVSRKGLRRAGQHHRLYRKFPMTCPNCNALTLPHHACSSCGTYKGREVFELRVRNANQEDGAEGDESSNHDGHQ